MLGIEVSRLARNNADWYQLLDLCAITDTLIADADGVYHPADFNDRLVLGLKGTMSEAELHLIRSRLTAGLKHKAAKGELRQGLPVGLDYDEDDKVVMTADEAVREAIATVFRRFEELGSARQVLIRLREDGVLLPRRRNGSRRITWAQATYPAVHDFLTNPAYAGAFVFGRTRTEKRVEPDHRGRALAGSAGAARAVGGADPRSSRRIHQLGDLRGQHRTAARQLAPTPRAGRRRGAGGPRAAAGLAAVRPLWADHADRLLGHQRQLPALSCAPAPSSSMPASTSARASAASGWRTPSSTRCSPCWNRPRWPPPPRPWPRPTPTIGATWRCSRLAIERARYEADRARRQFDNVEPENRLVARTLEKHLETKLAAVRAAENDLAAQRARRPVALTEQELAWIATAGADVRAIFDAPTTTLRERKQLIRAVIAEIAITVQRRTARRANCGSSGRAAPSPRCRCR